MKKYCSLALTGLIGPLLLLSSGCDDKRGSSAVESSGMSRAVAKPALAPVLHESFDYPVGENLLQQDGGSGFARIWMPGGFNHGDSANWVVAGGSLTYRHLATSGNHVTSRSSDTICGISRPLGYLIGVDGTTRYLSFLIRPEGTLNEGAWNGFFGLSLMSIDRSNLSPTGRPAPNAFAPQMSLRSSEIFFGKPGEGVMTNYVMENRGGSAQMDSGAPATLNETAFLVVRLEFGEADDIYTLYVNPEPGAPEPAEGISRMDNSLSLVDQVVLYSTGAFSVDEIRIGDTYESVTPVQP